LRGRQLLAIVDVDQSLHRGLGYQTTRRRRRRRRRRR
jgi:hypothetical protein